MESIKPCVKPEQIAGADGSISRQMSDKTGQPSDTFFPQTAGAAGKLTPDAIKRIILRKKTVSLSPQPLWERQLPQERRDHTGPSMIKNQMLFRDDKNIYALESKDGAVKWSIELNSTSTGARILEGRDGVIITDSLNNGGILAIDEKSGQKLWEKSPVKNERNISAGGDGTLLMGSWESEIACCDAASGDIRWKKSLPVAYTEAIGMTKDGSALFLGHCLRKNGENIRADDGQMKFIIESRDPKTGERKWRYTGNMMYVQGFNVSPGGDIIVRTQNRMISVDGGNGKEKWSLDMGAAVEDDPAFDEKGRMFFGDREGCFRAVDGSTGKVLWSHTTDACFTASPAVSGKGTVYTGDHNGALFAFNIDDGALVWGKQTMGKLGVAPILTDDGVLYLGMADHSTQKGVIDVLYALEPDSGKVMKSFNDLNGPKLCASPQNPDVLYVTHGNGKVLALSRNMIEGEDDECSADATPQKGEDSSIVQFDDIIILDGLRLDVRK